MPELASRVQQYGLSALDERTTSRFCQLRARAHVEQAAASPEPAAPRWRACSVTALLYPIARHVLIVTARWPWPVGLAVVAWWTRFVVATSWRRAQGCVRRDCDAHSRLGSVRKRRCSYRRWCSIHSRGRSGALARCAVPMIERSMRVHHGDDMPAYASIRARADVIWTVLFSAERYGVEAAVCPLDVVAVSQHGISADRLLHRPVRVRYCATAPCARASSPTHCGWPGARHAAVDGPNP